MFQQKTPTIHSLYTYCKSLCLDLLRCYYRQEVINANPEIPRIDPSDERHFAPLNHICFGAEIHRFIQTPKHRDKNHIHDVRTRCRQFLVAICVEIKKIFPLEVNLLKMCTYISVSKCTKKVQYQQSLISNRNSLAFG